MLPPTLPITSHLVRHERVLVRLLETDLEEVHHHRYPPPSTRVHLRVHCSGGQLTKHPPDVLVARLALRREVRRPHRRYDPRVRSLRVPTPHRVKQLRHGSEHLPRARVAAGAQRGSHERLTLLGRPPVHRGSAVLPRGGDSSLFPGYDQRGHHTQRAPHHELLVGADRGARHVHRRLERGGRE